MTTIVTYKHEGMQPIKVSYPEDKAPFILQSCYDFGSRGRTELCRSINEASEVVWATLSHAKGLRDFEDDVSDVAGVTFEVVEHMVEAMGFTCTLIDVA